MGLFTSLLKLGANVVKTPFVVLSDTTKLIDPDETWDTPKQVGNTVRGLGDVAEDLLSLNFSEDEEDDY